MMEGCSVCECAPDEIPQSWLALGTKTTARGGGGTAATEDNGEAKESQSKTTAEAITKSSTPTSTSTATLPSPPSAVPTSMSISTLGGGEPFSEVTEGHGWVSCSGADSAAGQTGRLTKVDLSQSMPSASIALSADGNSGDSYDEDKNEVMVSAEAPSPTSVSSSLESSLSSVDLSHSMPSAAVPMGDEAQQGQQQAGGSVSSEGAPSSSLTSSSSSSLSSPLASQQPPFVYRRHIEDEDSWILLDEDDDRLQGGQGQGQVPSSSSSSSSTSLFNPLSSLFALDMDMLETAPPPPKSGSIYVNLLDNPERFTGYTGEAAHRIWRAVHEENW